MTEKKSAKSMKPKIQAEEKTTREKISIYLAIIGAIAAIGFLLAISPREKPLTCSGDNGGSLTSFGSCR